MKVSNTFRSSVCAIAVGLFASTAYAIDPARAISQYVHDRWGIDQGFPRGAVYAITQTTDGYLWIGTEAGLVPETDEEFRRLLDAYLIEKSMYELMYELNNRPTWVRIPLTGILFLAG